MLKVDEQIGQLASDDYRYAGVLKKYDIDFCCGGGQTLEAVCQQKGIDSTELVKELEGVLTNKEKHAQDFKSWAPTQLINYIISKHHAYTFHIIDQVNEYLEKLCLVHGNSSPELFEIQKNWKVLDAELKSHMMKEESILFPAIQLIEKAEMEQSGFEPLPFGSINNPISMMELEHNDAGDELKAIRSLTNNFIPPEHACRTFIVCYKVLEEFENDLHKHIHLENNILFPMAIAMEQKLIAQ